MTRQTDLEWELQLRNRIAFACQAYLDGRHADLDRLARLWTRTVDSPAATEDLDEADETGK